MKYVYRQLMRTEGFPKIPGINLVYRTEHESAVLLPCMMLHFPCGDEAYNDEVEVDFSYWDVGEQEMNVMLRDMDLSPEDFQDYKNSLEKFTDYGWTLEGAEATNLEAVLNKGLQQLIGRPITEDMLTELNKELGELVDPFIPTPDVSVTVKDLGNNRLQADIIFNLPVQEDTNAEAASPKVLQPYTHDCPECIWVGWIHVKGGGKWGSDWGNMYFCPSPPNRATLGSVTPESCDARERHHPVQRRAE